MSDQSQIVPFVFEDQLIRTTLLGSAPWFVAKDVCAALCLKGNAAQITRRLPHDEKGVIQNHTPGGLQDMIVVSEPGLYRLIFRSDKMEAKRFQDFVFHEVLPALRKTGTFTIPGREAEGRAPADPDAMLELESIRTRLDMVREARQSFGRGAAQQIWRDCGLPMTAAMQWGSLPAGDRAQRGRLALRYLMLAVPDDGGSFGSRIVGRDRLPDIGLRVVAEADALAVSNTHQAIQRGFEDSPFANDWRSALRGIPGARAAESGLYFGRSKTRCTLIPMAEIEEALGSEVRP